MASDPRRQLPAIDKWLASPTGTALCAEYSRAEVVAVMRAHVAARRRALDAGASVLPDLDGPAYAALLRADLTARRRASLRPVINATGIVVHTNLGRAPLAPAALEAVAATARGYSNLELDLDDGKRGSRHAHVESLLTRLTGAEAALVVNNGAGAVLLALGALAKGHEVVVSRGELIEIGGSFRMPDVIAASGARMIEVGTTNRTTLADYAAAIGPETRALLTSHPSNYRIVGFTAKPELTDLAALARERGVASIQDLGSGCLVDLPMENGEAEPTVAASVAAGVDVVTFSGDKLLGGPQAGIVVGRAAWLERLEREPLLRALRIDKLSLAALEATLRLYLPPHDPRTEVPVLSMILEPKAAVARRARSLARKLRGDSRLSVALVDTVSYAGGGALPGQEIPSTAVRLRVTGIETTELARRLRAGTPAVIARIADDAVLLDPRTVAPEDLAALAAAVQRAATDP